MRDELSRRQRETLESLAAGRTDRETARAMGIGERTARTHVEDVITKLGAVNRVNAVHIAHKRGLLR